ncbi:MAG TPA: NADH-quinone oxidoreductase subunit C [Iamia sp.]|nr:NADH-quinone oxidoreductase subunit C [Iamia sp.]
MSPDTDAPTEDEAAPEEPRDEPREALRDRFAAELGDAVVDSHITVGHTLWVRVTADAWRTAGQVARDHLGMRWFDFLSAIDWLPSPYGRYEDDGMSPPKEVDPTIVTGVAGGDTRFQVFARVVNVSEGTDIIIKADVGDDLTMPSWVPTYDGADWHERECWEMFGLTFEGHPGLRHMYLPGDFEGNPMRKDFPLIARIVKPWPGIIDVEPMPAEDEEETPAETTEGADA